MPLYEYQCLVHGNFESVRNMDDGQASPCPECGQVSPRVLSQPALIRVHHTERLPYHHPLRVDDRRRMMKDPAVKKALSDYAESQRYASGSPFRK
jgi:putative FmdB family regulatory protein